MSACAIIAADDAEELDAAVVVALRLEPEIDGERADRLPVQRDRHADEAQLLLRVLGPARREIEERRLAAHARHDDRLAALDDLAGDALAELDADGARAILEALDGFDVQLAVAQQRDHAAHDAVMTEQRAQHALQRGLEIERARERLADLEQRRQPARVARGGGGVGSGFGGRHIRSPTYLRGDAASHAKLSSLGAWSNASTRQHVVGPAAGGHGALPDHDLFVVTEKSHHESVASSVS